MNQRTAQGIFIFFNIVAFFLVAYVINDFVNVISSVDVKKGQIIFDSGIYYFLLITVFWVFSIIQYAGLRNKESYVLKYANQLIIAWFILMLILANFLPSYIKGKFEDAGYSKCSDSREISRVARGESNIFSLTRCESNYD